MASAPDFLDRARLFGGIAVVVGGLILVTGSLLDWVTIAPPPVVPSDQLDQTRPFTGLAAGTGWVTLVSGVAAILNAWMLLRLKRSAFAWLAVLAAVLAGGVTMADFRGTGDPTGSLAERMEIVGRARPGIGMILCAVGALAVLIGGATGISATPKLNR